MYVSVFMYVCMCVCVCVCVGGWVCTHKTNHTYSAMYSAESEVSTDICISIGQNSSFK